MRSEWNATLSIFLAGALLGEVVVHSIVGSRSTRSLPDTVVASTGDVNGERFRRLESQYQRQLEELREARRGVQAPVDAGPQVVAAAPAAPSVSEAAANTSQSAVMAPQPPPATEQLPGYEVMHTVGDLRGRRTYGEILLPTTLQPADPQLAALVKQIAKHEGLDLMTLYRTPEAREAHYSMEYADQHPGALAAGLLGVYERGRFKPYRGN